MARQGGGGEDSSDGDDDDDDESDGEQEMVVLDPDHVSTPIDQLRFGQETYRFKILLLWYTPRLYCGTFMSLNDVFFILAIDAKIPEGSV